MDPLDDPKVRVALRESLRLRASDHCTPEAVDAADAKLARALKGRTITIATLTVEPTA